MAIPAAVDKDRFLRIAAVSYEGSVFGWDVNTNETTLDCTLGFGFHATQGSLKAVAVSATGKYMVCGGMDERIRIFNVSENRTLGELTGHSGCITCLKFVGDKFIVSGSEDNTLGIWRVQDWLCVHILGGHKAAITDIAVHPSGKLALSVSKDNTLKVWNLVQGRCAFTRRLHGHADKVEWCASGDMYSLVVGNELQVYNACDNSCIGAVKFAARINQARFTNIGAAAAGGTNPGHYITVVCEDRKMVIVDATCKALTSPYSLDFALSGGRPRDMSSVMPATVANSDVRDALDGEGHSLVIATSLGVVAVLSARALAEGNTQQEEDAGIVDEDPTGASFALQAVASTTAEPRLTAVVAWNPTLKAIKVTKVDKKKTKSAVGGDSSEEEDEVIGEEDAERANVTFLESQKKGAAGPQKHKERPVALLYDPKNDKQSKKERKEKNEKLDKKGAVRGTNGGKGSHDSGKGGVGNKRGKDADNQGGKRKKVRFH